MRRLVLAIIASALLSLPLTLFAATPLNSSQSEANSTFNNASAYVSYVNESSYLVFYPDLSAAYADLNKSANTILSSPQESMSYANDARQSAMLQYERINSYRYYSAAAMVVFTAAIAAILYFYMQPVKRRVGRKAS